MNEGIEKSSAAGEKSLVESSSPINISEYMQRIYHEKTPQTYVRMKDKFPYLPSKYVDFMFNKYFPVSSVKMIDRREDEYWITYTVELTVFLPGGMTITKTGTGASRKQVTREAKSAAERGERTITPFDYVDNGNASKAALTLAIKNAQERFGIGADITDRIILSEEEIQELNETITEAMKVITNPREQIKWNERLNECKSPSEKIRLLDDLREVYDIEDVILKNKSN